MECLLSSGPNADARPPVKLQDCLDAVARGESYLRLADGTIQPLVELGVAPQVAEVAPAWPPVQLPRPPGGPQPPLHRWVYGALVAGAQDLHTPRP